MSDERPHENPQPIRSTALLVALLALAKVAIHLATANRYGIFRDELYYLACARHLAWGYVDQPPLIALIAWLAAHLFGTSLLALRLLPALAGGLLVWLTAQIARELGGGRFAQTFAAFAIFPVPVYLVMNHWLTMNAFEPLFWTAALWLALRMLSRNEPRYWLAIGALTGIGLENKYSMLVLAAALVFALLLTPERRILRSRWFFAGAAIAFLLFLPNLLWLVHHNFPFLEFERHSRMSTSRIQRSPLAFVADQIVLMNPLLAPLWLGGLLWLFFAKPARAYRFLGGTFLAVFLLLLSLKTKNYYVAPAYPALFAAGAVAFEKLTEKFAGSQTPSAKMWTRTAYTASILLAGLVLAPLSIPILPIPQFLAYQQALGGFTPLRFENERAAPLPQHFADEFGWEDMARATGRIFAALPPAEQRDTAIFGNDYGQAAAIDFFGPRYGLPPAIGNNESYWLWGPRDYTGKTVIVLGSDVKGDRKHFATVEPVARIDNPYARASEHFDINLCRNPTTDLRSLWPTIKKW